MWRPHLPRHALTIGVSAVLVSSGVFGWGEGVRSQAAGLLHWGAGHGTACTLPGFAVDSGAPAAAFLQGVRGRLDARLPIYVVRDEPIDDPLVRLPTFDTLSTHAPGGDDPITSPAAVSVVAAPQELGCLFLLVTTMYGADDHAEDDPGAVEPVYVLRPAPGVTVRVDSALAPGAPSDDVRAWLASHLVPYEG